MVRLTRRAWLAPVALSIVAAACGGGAPAPQQPVLPAAPAPGGVEPGRQAPDFAITTTDGEPFRLSAHRDRVVVLDFLAPGCPSCAAEVPSLGEVWTAFRDDGAVVVVVDIGGVSAEEVISYYRGELGGADHLYAVDEGFRVATLYKVLALGTCHRRSGGRHQLPRRRRDPPRDPRARGARGARLIVRPSRSRR